MSRRTMAVALTLLGLLALAPRTAVAQIAVGASVGRLFDTDQDWVVLGVDARLAIKGKPFEFNPRVTYNPGGCCSTTQVDANLIYRPELAGGARVRPYVGGGLAMVRESFTAGSENTFALNAVAGLELTLANSRLRPFLHSEYTGAKNFGNIYTMAVGVLYSLK